MLAPRVGRALGSPCNNVQTSAHAHEHLCVHFFAVSRNPLLLRRCAQAHKNHIGSRLIYLGDNLCIESCRQTVEVMSLYKASMRIAGVRRVLYY